MILEISGGDLKLTPPAHILDQLLAKGHTVVTTVRSEAKAAKIREAYPSQASSGALSVAIVPDIAQPDAFDEVVKTTPGLEVVLHTASPFHFNFSSSLSFSPSSPPFSLPSFIGDRMMLTIHQPTPKKNSSPPR